MSSRKARKAARINGAKAAGCKSPEGLQKSSMNAIRHGLTSKTLVLCNESQTQFDELLQGYLRRFNPRDAVEDDLVTEMVAARWRLQRIWLIQTSTLDLKMAMMESELEELFIKAVPEPARISLAFSALANQEKTLQLLLRYESTYRCIYNQAQKDLLRLRESERCEKLRNEPNEVPKPLAATVKTPVVHVFPPEPPAPVTTAKPLDPPPASEIPPTNPSRPPEPHDRALA